ncbi:enoyl-CoA hydratase/isomerase family protein [Ruminococcus sp. HUN007]|uniref:enoyl-CoA hydratase/isomerase family protein n=1 Tax=Ruminococcus sp. HUN007 TaxID=1514668 RepID=UPI0005D2758A|nr:enoyl-CoA hydratase/isomerase family protein [Ruminococcus sp. HUN007]
MPEISSNISVLEIKDDKAILTLNNGPKNLLSIPEFFSLDLLKKTIDSNPQLKALIITGAGRHFSHGADTSKFSPEGLSEIPENLRKSRELLNYIEALPLVTAAAVNGGCFGGGMEVAMSCQFRVCSKNAVFALPETSIGVIPGMSGVERLARLVGKSKAISMVLGGNMISASEAADLGIADLVTEEKNCLDKAVEFVTELTADRTVLQIRSVVSRVNKALASPETDVSDDSFEKILEEKLK